MSEQFGEFSDLVPEKKKKPGDFGEFSDLVTKAEFGEFSDLVPEEKESGGFLRGTADFLEDFGSGRITQTAGRNFFQGIIDAIVDLKNAQLSVADSQFRVKKTRDLPEVEKPKTKAGQIASDVIEFSMGFVPLVKAFGGTTKLAKAGAAVTAGALTEGILRNPNEENLSNFLLEHARFKDPITKFLASDPDDSRAKARLKKALEGAVFGAAFETLFASLRLVKFARQARVADDAVAASESGKPVRAQASTPEEVLQQRGELPEKAGNLNLTRQNISDEAKVAEVTIADANEGFIKARRDVVSNAQLKELAEDVGMTPKKLLKTAPGETLSPEGMLAARNELARSGEELVDAARFAVDGDIDKVFIFQTKLVSHAALQERVAGLTAEAGRLLQQFNIPAGSTLKARETAIKEIMDLGGGREFLGIKAKHISTLKDPAQLGKYAARAAKPTTIDKLMEVWINSLLSGPQTHVVNATSNGLVALYSVPERFTAAGIGALSGGAERVFFRESVAQLSGMLKGMRDATEAAWKTLRTEEVPEILAGAKIELARRQSISGLKGKIIRTPGRLLESADVWFKMINYGGEVEALAVRDGIKQGLGGAELRSHVAEILRSPPAEMASQAWKKARVNTFTNPLAEQKGVFAGTAKKVSELANEHPLVRLIVPFIRTPTNILKFSLERSPLGFAMKDMREALKAGGAARQEALAEIALGTSISATTFQLASEGIITGGGPPDPRERSGKFATGWQPYSILIDGKYFSYARFEPLGTLLGVAADMSEISDRISDTEREKLATMVMTAIAKNGTNKTFLRGMSDLIKAVDPNNPRGGFGKFVEKLAASATVPVGVAQIGRINDPVLRDTRGILDRIITRAGFGEGNVEPLLNIWGEEIRLEGGLGPDILSPVYISKQRNDKVSDEVVRLRVSPSMPRRQIDGVDLTAEEYTMYSRTAGQGAKRILDLMVASPKWAGAPDFLKRELIRDTINQQRDIARVVLLANDDDLQQRIIEKQRQELNQQ